MTSPLGIKLRKEVFDRDGGICNVCARMVAWEEYHCGHVIDRVCGGSDEADNLVVMCAYCNMYNKPLHETKEEYREWVGKIRSIQALWASCEGNLELKESLKKIRET